MISMGKSTSIQGKKNEQHYFTLQRYKTVKFQNMGKTRIIRNLEYDLSFFIQIENKINTIRGE